MVITDSPPSSMSRHHQYYHWLVGDATVFLETRLTFLLLNIDFVAFRLIDFYIPNIENISYFLLYVIELSDEPEWVRSQ